MSTEVCVPSEQQGPPEPPLGPTAGMMPLSNTFHLMFYTLVIYYINSQRCIFWPHHMYKYQHMLLLGKPGKARIESECRISAYIEGVCAVD